jgi:hypothetical protein
VTRDTADLAADGDDAASNLIEGKYAILVVFLLGLLGAVGSWWYHSQLQRQAIAFWGTQNAALIQRAPHVDFMQLEPAETAASGNAAETLKIGGRPYLIVRRIDGSRTSGLIHLRHSLVQDGSYNWSLPLSDCRPDWQYALRFEDAGASATVALDFSCGQLLALDMDKQLSIQPMAEGLEEFMTVQFGERPAEPPTE